MAEVEFPSSIGFAGLQSKTGGFLSSLFSFLDTPVVRVFVLNKGFITYHTHEKLESETYKTLKESVKKCDSSYVWQSEDPKSCKDWIYDPSTSPCIGMTETHRAEVFGADSDSLDMSIEDKKGASLSLSFLNLEDKKKFCVLLKEHIAIR